MLLHCLTATVHPCMQLCSPAALQRLTCRYSKMVVYVSVSRVPSCLTLATRCSVLLTVPACSLLMPRWLLLVSTTASRRGTSSCDGSCWVKGWMEPLRVRKITA
jgi:hypothetical protein